MHACISRVVSMMLRILAVISRTLWDSYSDGTVTQLTYISNTNVNISSCPTFLTTRYMYSSQVPVPIPLGAFLHRQPQSEQQWFIAQRGESTV